MEPTVETAREIVRRSGSNLAFALAVLPKGKRRDMEIFYAFCRVVDDLADDPGLSLDDRLVGLERWRKLIHGCQVQPAPGIESEFVKMRTRYALSDEVLEEIVAGVEMDLELRRFETAAELRRYCYRVASAVGLASIEIFGYQDPATKRYAEELGYALQWTNIMRDVGEDAREGRVFVPREDLRQYGLSESDLLGGRPDGAKFQRLMKHQAGIARTHYQNAISTLPPIDRKSMRSAELMRRIYSAILDRMEEDGFHVFEKRYRLSKPRMIFEFFRARCGG